MGFFTGTKGRYENVLSPEAQGLYSQLLAALQGQGAGGAYGSVADYYRDLLSPDSRTFQEFAAPEMRRFQEDIIPGLAEQFAGMGSGGLSSSGFRNAGVQAGTDLSERLGALRAQLRQQGAQGLSGLGSQGLNVPTAYRQGQPGFLDFGAQALGAALPFIGAAAGGPIGSAIGGAVSGMIGRKSNPYGQMRGQQPAYYPGGG